MNQPSILLLLTLLGAACSLYAGELPEFSPAATLTGAATTARFRAGVSTDDGSSFGDHAGANTPTTIRARIEVDPDHVGRVGRLYVVIALGDELFQQLDNGAFEPWNGSLGSLQPAHSSASLAPVEELSVIEGMALGPFGLAGAELAMYLGYDTDSNPDELTFSDTPLRFSIDSYDPANLPFAAAQVIDTLVVDNSRQREIPVLVYLPDNAAPAPVVLFSHGLGGSRFTVEYLPRQWARRGYAVVNLQHPGSDASILDVPAGELLAAMQAAASLENAILRIGDVSRVLDELVSWNEESGSMFFQRFDLESIGMSGHSFGARTTQSVSGEDTPFIAGETRDPRIDAAIMFSPSPPAIGSAEAALAGVDIPWLLMTGTNDDSNITNVEPEDRLKVFPALPPGSKYELVLFEGEHHAFTDREIGPLQSPRNPAHHGIIEALSTAFWDSYLGDDLSARAWLDGAGAEAVLLAGDRWQRK